MFFSCQVCLNPNASFRFEDEDLRPKCPIGPGTILTSHETCKRECVKGECEENCDKHISFER